MTSVSVVHSAPEMAVMAIRCMDSSCFVAPTDLVALKPCTALVTSAYHTSMAYVNLGTATVQHSCLINLPVDSFVSQWNCSVHLALMPFKPTCQVGELLGGCRFGASKWQVSVSQSATGGMWA